MALKLVIQLSKKIPGPSAYSSIQASCSIDTELAAGQDPTAEAAHLYAQAEAAVDCQLGIAPASTSHPSPTPAPVTMATSSASRPYTRPPRRGALVTPAQLRLIDQLLRDTRTDAGAVLQHFGVTAIDQIACKDASALIDDLKSRAGASAGGGRP
jgi:hypothetical protein